MKFLNGIWVKRLGNILTVASLAFIVWKLFNLELKISSFHNSWPRLIICALIAQIPAILGVALNSRAWQFFLETLSKRKLNFWEVFHIYAKANIGKYLPGNVMHFVERNLFATSHGLGQLETLTSTLMEILSQLLAALIISVALAFPQLKSFISQNLTWNRSLIVLFLLLASGAVMVLIYRNSARVREITACACTLSFARAFVIGTFFYALSFAANCLTILLALYSIEPLDDLTNLPLIFAMNTLAWLVGFVTPGAPGGLGIREFVLVTMASSTPFSQIILIAAVSQRFVMIAADFLAYLLGNFLFRPPLPEPSSPGTSNANNSTNSEECTKTSIC